MANVKFFSVKLKSTWEALETKDNLALYWIDETQELYKGDKLYGIGKIATEEFDGLLSKEDYSELKKLIAAGPASGTIDLTPIDGSIIIEDKKIGVGLSDVKGNILSKNDDGLFATVDLLPVEGRLDVVESRLDAVEKAAVGGIHYRGSVYTYEDLPTDAQRGDLYEVLEDHSEWCWNGEEWFQYGSTVGLVPVEGQGIQINGSEISVKIADNSHGLVVVDGALTINLATAKNDGAMSKEDKAKIDAIPTIYVAKKYEIADAPYGTLVNYGEDEIRIMCPANAEYHLQNVGAGGDSNTYYVTLKTYAPNDDCVGYKEHLGTQVDAEILTDLKVDAYGRKYQPSWLGVAKHTDGVWAYYGDNSSAEKMIGWDYRIDWYDADGVMIATDSIRINLSNEDCHNAVEPYYISKFATSEELEAAKAEITETFSWGEM